MTLDEPNKNMEKSTGHNRVVTKLLYLGAIDSDMKIKPILIFFFWYDHPMSISNEFGFGSGRIIMEAGFLSKKNSIQEPQLFYHINLWCFSLFIVKIYTNFDNFISLELQTIKFIY